MEGNVPTDLLLSALIGVGASLLFIAVASVNTSENDNSKSAPREIVLNEEEEENSESREKTESNAIDDMDVVFKINATHAAKKIAPFQRFLGLSNEQVHKIIEQTNDEIDFLNEKAKSEAKFTSSSRYSGGNNKENTDIIGCTSEAIKMASTSVAIGRVESAGSGAIFGGSRKPSVVIDKNLNYWLDFMVYSILMVAIAYIMFMGYDSDYMRALRGLLPAEMNSVNIEATKRKLSWLKSLFISSKLL